MTPHTPPDDLGTPHETNTPAPSGDAQGLDIVVEALAGLPRSSPVRVAARQLLAGQRPSSLQVFIGPLRSSNAKHWRERLVAAWALGRAPATAAERESAAIALMDALQDAGQGPGQGWFPRGLGRTLAAAFALTLLIGFTSGPFYPDDAFQVMSIASVVLSPIVLSISSVFDTSRTDRVRAAIARASARLGVVDSIGPLAEAYVRGSGLVADATREALLELLPQVQPLHYGILGASSMLALCRTLRSNDSLLVVQSLHALKCVGTSQALPELERLADCGRTMRIRDEAGRVLEVVRARSDSELHRERLLRPATSPGENLLRPAPGASSGDPDFLLRAVVGEDEGQPK